MTLKNFKYSNAPITEALIDFQFEKLDLQDIGDLKKIWKGISSDYNSPDPIKIRLGEFSFGASLSSSLKEEHIGYRFKSNDSKFILQCRIDGFTISRLAPYDCWQNIQEEAKKLWALFIKTIPMPKFLRISVRYINKIKVPYSSRLMVDIDDYLRTAPKISDELPQTLYKFFMQVVVPREHIDGFALINQTIAEQNDNDFLSLILDIDIFKNSNFPQDNNELWELIEAFRNEKNTVFEACITDKTRELFR